MMDYNTKEIKKYQFSYVTQCTLEHLVALLATDSFLAKLLSHIGLSDAMVGIITTFSSVAFIFQLLSIKLVQSKMSTKKMVMFFDIISQMFFMLIYVVPFMPFPAGARKISVMIMIMVAYSSKNIISSMYFKWGNTYVNPKSRATFSAAKECISLICGIIFSAVIGHIVDIYELAGNVEGAFLVIAAVLLVINIGNFVSLLLIKDESVAARREMRVPLKELLQHLKENRLFSSYMATNCISHIASGLIVGFIGIYKTKDLAMSLFSIQMINIIGNFIRMGVSMPFARYSNKNGYGKGIFLGNILICAGYISLVFTTPETIWLVVMYTFLYNAAQAGKSQNSFNIGYTILPQKYMVQAMALNGSVAGAMSLLASIVGGRILSAVQMHNNIFLGMHIYGQQLLAFLALITEAVSLILQNKYVLKPLKKMNK